MTHNTYYAWEKEQLLAGVHKYRFHYGAFIALITNDTPLLQAFDILITSPLTTSNEKHILTKHHNHILAARAVFPPTTDPLRSQVLHHLGAFDFDELRRMFQANVWAGGNVWRHYILDTNTTHILHPDNGPLPYYVHIPSKEVAKRPTLLAIEPRDLEGVYKKKHWRASSYGAIGAEVKAPKARFYADVPENPRKRSGEEYAAEFYSDSEEESPESKKVKLYE